MRKRNTLALHCGSQIHVAKIIKRSFSTLLHVCPYRVETKSSRLFNGVNGNAKPVNSSMGKLTLPSAADFSCIFSLSLSIPAYYFSHQFVTHSNNSVCVS